MAEISKQALIVENNQSFPNNNNGAITPSALRNFNTDMIDSTVNQTAFNNYTQSFTNAFSSLNAFTASIAGTNAFTQSADQRLDDLESWSSSLDVNYASQAEFNAYTQSQTLLSQSFDLRIDNLESWSSSLDTNYASQTEFNSYTQSNDAKVNSLIAFTSSVLSISALQPLNQASASLQAFTASVAGTNTFTQSAQLEINALEAFTQSAQLEINALEGFTASVAGTNAFTASIAGTNAFTASQLLLNSTFATTGSNVFTGDQLISGSLEVGTTSPAFKVNTTASFYGNSVFMIADGFTSSLAFVTASVSGSDSNLIFKSNALTTPTIVSGSSNIFQSPIAATATFVRYIGGSSNLFLTSGSVPQVTSSVGIQPVMTGNIGTGTGFVSARTPVSSSTWNISNNIFANSSNVVFGTAAGTAAVSASAGLTFTNNIVNGGINVTAYKTTLTSAPSITLNSLGGTLTLNMDSSSISIQNSTIQSTLTVNSSYSASAGGGGNFMQILAGSAIFGSNNVLFASGSNTTVAGGRTIFGTSMFGSHHTASVNLLGDNSNLFSTALIGHGLSITGSSAQFAGPNPAADRGTVIVGRFNAETLSNNTVFAVGTGTSYTGRRTGLLIDSGSNVYVSGSLNIAANTSITGSLVLSSSADIELNVIGNVAVTGSMTFLSGSASGSVVTNIGDTFTGTAAVTKIISLSSAEYAALSPVDPNTLYIIV